MPKHIFVFGRQPKLGLAELSAITNKSNLQAVADGQASIASMSIVDPQAYLDQLGGCVKLAKLIKTPGNEDDLIDTMLANLPSLAEKIFFGISYLGQGRTNKHLKQIKNWGMKLKKQLKRNGQSARFVSSKEPVLSSVIARKNKLLSKNGKEFLVIANDRNGFYLAETLAVQDFSAYGHRDYGRPKRDPKRGSLPPKLAQIMLNLGKVKPGQTIYDPFCGQGTILQEALLKGANAIGSDIDQAAIDASRKNLEWLRNQGLEKLDSKPDYQLFTTDAKSLSALPEKLPRLDAIITEGDLGSPISKPLLEMEARHRLEKSVALIKAALDEVKDALAPGGLAVICLPFYKTNNGWLSTATAVQKISEGKWLITQGPLSYMREKQFVGRQIWTLAIS